MFVCKSCNLELNPDSYYFNTTGGRYHACKDCVKKKNRESYNNPETKEKIRKKHKEYSNKPENIEANRIRGSNFYNTTRGRAMSLFKSAQRRSGNFPETFDLDLEFILEKLNLGVCEVTGAYFDFNSPTDTSKNPYAPSIDRIDSNIGYTKANTRIVIWQYNLMKGELSDDELLNICKLLLERKK